MWSHRKINETLEEHNYYIRKEKVTDHIEQELELSIINIIIMREIEILIV